MLGPAQTDPLGAVGAGPLGVRRVVGVRPHLEPPELIRPLEQPHQPRVLDVRHDRVELVEVHLAGRPIDGDPVTFFDVHAVHGHRPGLHVDLQLCDTNHGGLAELSGHQGGVARPPAAAGEDPVGGEHAVDVVRLRLRPHHDHVLALFLRPLLGEVGIEGDHPDRRAG